VTITAWAFWRLKHVIRESVKRRTNGLRIGFMIAGEIVSQSSNSRNVSEGKLRDELLEWFLEIQQEKFG
jgi:hypothetical protein